MPQTQARILAFTSNPKNQLVHLFLAASSYQGSAQRAEVGMGATSLNWVARTGNNLQQ